MKNIHSSSKKVVTLEVIDKVLRDMCSLLIGIHDMLEYGLTFDEPCLCDECVEAEAKAQKRKKHY